MKSLIILAAAMVPITGLRSRDLEGADAAEKAKRKGKSKVVQRPLGKDWQIPDDKEKFHVFLLYGQSNMAGGIKKHQPGHLLPEDKIPTPHLLQVRSGRPLSVSGGWFPAVHPLHIRPGRPNSFGLGIPFAKEYMKRNPGVTVGLLPCAWGGKRMDLLKKGSGLYKAALGRCRFAMERGTIKGILWHQGESDAFHEERSKTYEAELHEMIAGFRKDLNIPDLPFISGEITLKYPKTNLVQVANRTLPEKVKNTGWVTIEGLTFVDGNKRVHFDRESYIKLGHRYCDALLKVMNREKRDKEKQSQGKASPARGRRLEGLGRTR